MKRSLAILVVLLCAASARAQFAVYGMGSAGRLSRFNSIYATTGPVPTLNSAGNFWAYGGTAGIYDDFLKLGPIKLGGDVRGFIERSSNSNNTYGNQLRGGLIGLRLALHAPLVPVKPYIQAEIGGASTNYGQNSSNTGNFAYQVQLGADFTIFPHVDLRAEYGLGQLLGVLGSNNSNMQQLGAGLALRF
ncbi:MAG TPA: outer membrane beta-barrel protein [Acidobacteriaceae bacterium]